MLRLGRKPTAPPLRAAQSTIRSAAIEESTFRDLCKPGVWNDHNINRDSLVDHLAAWPPMALGYCDPKIKQWLGSLLKFARDIYGTGVRFQGRVRDWKRHERNARLLGADG